MDGTSLDKRGRVLLDIFGPLLIENLRPSELTVQIPDLAELTDRMTKMEKQGHQTEAVKLFLGKLILCQTGWFQQFLEALERTDNQMIHRLLCCGEKNPHEVNSRIINKQKILKRLLAVFMPELIKITPSDITPYLQCEGCLNDQDVQLITADEHNRGTYSAMPLVLLLIARRHEDWYIKFVKVVKEHVCEDLAKKLELNIENSEKFNSTIELNQLDSTERVYEGHTGEEGMDMDVGSSCHAFSKSPSTCAEAPAADSTTEVGKDNTNTSDLATTCSGHTSGGYSNPEAINQGNTSLATGSQGSKKLYLRNYQEELAAPGIDGKNVIVQAPTGSGKTHVALKIAQEHLSSAAAAGEHRVVFFVPTVSLVDQQLKSVESYLGELKSIGLSGESESSGKASLVMHSNQYDFIVCTPQIFLDALREEKFGGFSNFTLIIFDECHHCLKNHPYNSIMHAYMDEKLVKDNPNLPQVVGLTASVGSGGGNDVDQTVGHVMKLCANLDADCLQIVREFKDELDIYANRPGEDSVQIKSRLHDPFCEMLSEIMKIIETEMGDKRRIKDAENEVPNISQLLTPPSERGGERYTTWLSKLNKPVSYIHDQKTRRFYVACREHLKVYNDALVINADGRSKDALAYLQNEIPQLKIKCRDETDEWLEKLYKEKEKRLENISLNDKYINPKLEEIKRRVLATFVKEPDSRAIIFVKTRALTLALEKWMQETGCLSGFNPARLVGSTVSSEHGGMTGSQQTGVLKNFQNGVVKILIATSVAEEGLDIQRCNLVIRYLHVTNDIARVQTMGRSRARDADYVVLADDDGKASRKEDENRMKQKMADEAIGRIHRLKPEVFKRRVCAIQQEEKIKRDMEMSGRRRARQIGQDEYQLRCLKCDALACHSGDLRKIENTHHVVVEDTFHVRVMLSPHPNPKRFGENNNWNSISKVHCKVCQRDWGIEALYKDLKFTVIKIASFVLVDTRDVRSSVNKWKNAPFVVQSMTPDDLQMAAQSQY